MYERYYMTTVLVLVHFDTLSWLMCGFVVTDSFLPFLPFLRLICSLPFLFFSFSLSGSIDESSFFLAIVVMPIFPSSYRANRDKDWVGQSVGSALGLPHLLVS